MVWDGDCHATGKTPVATKKTMKIKHAELVEAAGLREAAPFTSRTSVQVTGFRMLVFFLVEQRPCDVGILLRKRFIPNLPAC